MYVPFLRARPRVLFAFSPRFSTSLSLSRVFSIFLCARYAFFHRILAPSLSFLSPLVVDLLHILSVRALLFRMPRSSSFIYTLLFSLFFFAYLALLHSLTSFFSHSVLVPMSSVNPSSSAPPHVETFDIMADVKESKFDSYLQAVKDYEPGMRMKGCLACWGFIGVLLILILVRITFYNSLSFALPFSLTF